MSKDQFELYGGPPPHSNPTTSKQAAGGIEPKTPSLRDQVLEFIRSRGDSGATDQEMQHALGLAGDTQRPRRWELVKLGLVVDSGRQRSTWTSTKRGKPGIVWVAA